VGSRSQADVENKIQNKTKERLHRIPLRLWLRRTWEGRGRLGEHDPRQLNRRVRELRQANNEAQDLRQKNKTNKINKPIKKLEK